MSACDHGCTLVEDWVTQGVHHRDCAAHDTLCRLCTAAEPTIGDEPDLAVPYAELRRAATEAVLEPYIQRAWDFLNSLPWHVRLALRIYSRIARAWKWCRRTIRRRPARLK